MTYTLRHYQQEAIDSVFDYFRKYSGNPILCLPTGSGKSIIQSAFIKHAITLYPGTRILCLSHVKELLEQNFDKIKAMSPQLDVGIYSAGLKQKDTDNDVVVAGIQSCYKKAHEFGLINLIIIDECHLLSPAANTRYQKFIDELSRFNPKLKIIGMSATPFRTGSGLLTSGNDSIFTHICYDCDVRELIKLGYLCDLKTVGTKEQVDVSGVKIRAGDYAKGELSKKVDNAELTRATIKEALTHCVNRNSWLVFCCGVSHAHNVCDEIRSHGMSCEALSGKTPADERDRILRDFKAGKIKALTNANILTTGFDAPNIDTLIMLRPTKSPGLYVQMIGRAMRVHESKTESMILDFTDNILCHGPIDRIKVRQKFSAEGCQDMVTVAPQKKCPKCNELNDLTAKNCIGCDHKFTIKESILKHSHILTDAPIISGKDFHIPKWINIDNQKITRHTKVGKPDSIKISYFSNGINVGNHWVCLFHDGFARQKAMTWWVKYIERKIPKTIDDAINTKIPLPNKILVRSEGKYNKILDWSFA